jgi:hypothetical protein
MFDEAELANWFMKKLTRNRVAPIISARVSCEILGMNVPGVSSWLLGP